MNRCDGSPAHLQTTSRVTPSMGRTATDTDKVQSACVACQAPCVAINSEHTFWSTRKGQRGLGWTWGSDPGLVLAA